MLLAAGLQDSSDWGVPDSGVLHDQGPEELPTPQPPCHGLCLPLQAGQHPALLSLDTHAHASFAVQSRILWPLLGEKKTKEKKRKCLSESIY